MGKRISNNYTTKEGVSNEAPSLFRCISVGNLSYFDVTMVVVSEGIGVVVIVSVDMVTVMLSADMTVGDVSADCEAGVGAMCMSS